MPQVSRVTQIDVGRRVTLQGGRGLKITLPAGIREQLAKAEKAKDLAGWVNLVTNDGFAVAEFFAGVMWCEDAPLKDRMAAAKELKEISIGKAVQPLSIPALDALLLRQSGISTEDAAALDAGLSPIPADVLNAKPHEIPTAAAADGWEESLAEIEDSADGWGDDDLFEEPPATESGE